MDVLKPELYIAGPFTADTPGEERANIMSAVSDAKVLWGIGFRCFIPHVAFGLETTDHSVELGVRREDIMASCFNHLAACDGIFLMHGYKNSAGALREFQFAKQMKKFVLHDFNEAKEFFEKYQELNFYR